MTMTETERVVSLTEFLERLADRYSAPIASVTLRTEPETLTYRRGSKREEANRWQGGSLIRLARGSFQLGRVGSTYSNRVNNAIMRHAEDGADVVTFAADALWRGFGAAGPVPFTATHTTTGLLYLACYPPTNGTPHKGEDQWTLDGRIVEGEELATIKADWLKASGPSQKQADAGLADPATQVYPRLPHLENVVSITIQTRTGGLIEWNENGGVVWEP